MASTGTDLVLWRLVQGSGAALGFATATPLLVGAFPPRQRVRALGINSTAWVTGMIVGPVVGGALVGSVGWRWIFYVTVPFALAGVLAGAFALPAVRLTRQKIRPDWTGAVSFSLVLLGFFVPWERRVMQPLFELALFRQPYFWVGMVVVTTYSLGIMAMTFLLTFYLQGAPRLSPLYSGLMLVPMAAPQFVLAPVGSIRPCSADHRRPEPPCRRSALAEPARTSAVSLGNGPAAAPDLGGQRTGLAVTPEAGDVGGASRPSRSRVGDVLHLAQFRSRALIHLGTDCCRDQPSAGCGGPGLPRYGRGALPSSRPCPGAIHRRRIPSLRRLPSGRAL